MADELFPEEKNTGDVNHQTDSHNSKRDQEFSYHDDHPDLSFPIPQKTVSFASIKRPVAKLDFITGSFQEVYLAGTEINEVAD